METGKKMLAVVGVITGVVVILAVSLICVLTTSTPKNIYNKEYWQNKDFLYIGDTSYLYALPEFHRTTPCEDLVRDPVPPHPLEGLHGAVAGLHLGSLIICGGEPKKGQRKLDGRWSSPDRYQSSCHTLTAAGWEQSDSLPGPAQYAAVSQGPGGLLVTGGITGYSGRTNRTQTYSGAGWTLGPALPVNVSGHCQVNTEEGVVVVGGQSEDFMMGYSARVFLLQAGRWTELPSMSTPREGHACVLYNHELWAIGGATSSVEILNLGTKTWRAGPAVPESMYLNQAVVYENQLYAIDEDGPVYRLSEYNWLKVADIQLWALKERPLFPAPIVNRQSLKC